MNGYYEFLIALDILLSLSPLQEVADTVVLSVLFQCSDYVKGYNDGYSSTCGKNPDGCNNILSAISPDPFYTSGWE